MTLNEGQFSAETVIIHFLDKPYQKKKIKKSFKWCTTL